MGELTNLNDLLIHELSDLYSAENQLVEALPKMAEAASSVKLREAFEEHLTVTKGHVERLDKVFKLLKAKPSGETCVAMKGLIAEAGKILKEKGKAESPVLDAALIASAQRVEHYELAGYGCVRSFCEQLELPEAAKLLQQTLDEEGAANRMLSELAISGINKRAAAAAG